MGVRTIALDTSGGRFAFSVNGICVFAQGANLIWARQFGDSSSLYPERLFLGDSGLMGELEVMRWQGYNMVRVWGGGAYPSEAFYDRCDALGIMVWQDLMFNGTMYPDDLGHFVSKSSSIFAGSQKESSGQNQLFRMRCLRRFMLTPWDCILIPVWRCGAETMRSKWLGRIGTGSRNTIFTGQTVFVNGRHIYRCSTR